LPDHRAGARWVLESRKVAGDTTSVRDDQVAPNIQQTPRLPKAPLNTIKMSEHGLLAQKNMKATLFYLHPLEPAPQSWTLFKV